MSKLNRKRYNASFKSKVALEAIRGDLTLSEISAKYGIGQTQVANWKRKALEGMQLSFERGPKSAFSRNQDEHIKELHAKIGELTLERDFLEKASRL
jgi:transposase